MSGMLGQGFTFPSGMTVSNRIVKAATEELLAPRDGSLSEELMNLYRCWGASGAGMIITGNMFVSHQGLARLGNTAIVDQAGFRSQLQKLAGIIGAHGARSIVQLNHGGRQTVRNTGQTPVAPSAVPMKGFGPIFRTPRELQDQEIEHIIEQFIDAARIVFESGFHGVEVHAAHGYLLNQFLSPHVNRRQDRWGGPLSHRAAPLVKILQGIRKILPAQLTLGVKINSADFQRGGLGEDDALALIDILNRENIDFIEISGGNYESPAMMGVPLSTQRREAYFLEFAQAARRRTAIPLMLTGGFRSAAFMNQTLEEGAVDLIGLARPIILEPALPQRLLLDPHASSLQPRDKVGWKKIDDMLQSFWYKRQIKSIAERGRSLGPNASRWKALVCELPKVLF